MKRFYAVLLVFVMVAGISGLASAAYAPMEFLYEFGGVEYPGHADLDVYTGIWHVYNVPLPNPQPNYAPVFTGSFSFFLKWDPYISYSMSMTNTTNDIQNFSFAFTAPMMTMSGPNTVKAEITSESTAQSFTASQVSFLSDSSSSPYTWTTMGVDLNISTAIPYASKGPVSGPTGDWQLLRIETTGTLSPGDWVSLYGMAGIYAAPVPVPATLLLLAPGLAGLAAVRRRFRR